MYYIQYYIVYRNNTVLPQKCVQVPEHVFKSPRQWLEKKCPNHMTTEHPIHLLTEHPVHLLTEHPIQFSSEYPIQFASENRIVTLLYFPNYATILL